MFRRFLRLFVLVGGLAYSCGYVYAAHVTLAWDANSPADNVIVYRLYIGHTSGSYYGSVDIRDATKYTFMHISAGTYYFAVTAINSGGESDYSNEVMATLVDTVNDCDLNYDNGVNVIDMQLLINSILANDVGAPGDINLDFNLNVLDLQILINTVLGRISCPLH